MNTAINQYDAQEFDYRVQFRSTSGSADPAREEPKSNAPRFRRKRGGHPMQFNGMHRRRTKKIRW